MADHSIVEELGRVHDKMKLKYNLERSAKSDIARAKKMEKYLRAIKTASNRPYPSKMTKYQKLLNQGVIDNLTEAINTSMNITNTKSHSLFRKSHGTYHKQQSQWGADDVFEAEFARLLQQAGKMALVDQNVDVDIDLMGVNIIGGKSANINQAGLKIMEDVMQELGDKEVIDEFIDRTSIPSDMMEKPEARSAKVDVTGYSAEWYIESEVKPEWRDFIKTFTGAKFTLKNYNSWSQSTTTIHLGTTNPYKAMYGMLSALNFAPKDAAHIYFHSVGSYNKPNNKNEADNKADIANHVIHIRFAYELTGEGLYVGDTRLDAADFFIYNDPGTDRIWVKSTKEMIAKMEEYRGNVGNPFHSGIVLLKQSFT